MNPIENHPRRNAAKAFTLIELLVVMSIIVVLMALLAPSFVNISSANNVSKSVYDIAGILDQARTYAMGNNTFVFVGIAEVDSAYTPTTGTTFVSGGIGKVVIAVVASKDGTLGFDVTSSTPDTDWKTNYSNYNGVKGNAVNLVAISKLQSFDHAHLSSASTASSPDYIPNPPAGNNLHRETVSTNGTSSYQLGNSQCKSITPFDWPLGSALGSGQYSFTKVINFDPQGVARIRTKSDPDTIVQYMEIGLMPAHGSTYVPPPTNSSTFGNVAAIQINAMTGANRVYRP
jgi:prepilin-type N-terminal cleavage/methylation domain-containing protein